ncbi:hypothetical protein ATPR_1368 [Acetobacter tropicalis NBRC 101654]|uniref:Uncharacterized protein n=1 Tax=Acetobacter tropicalis NBRC 101654 TaxID=749388 RepID=F7VDB9_9PROT|nr:hypothetical protein [Acetobacter tropicalis]GAA08364.1 hypothetical protein ATPR_1368 [Acetobacter tropicalis NBRC 101654]
MSHPSHTPPALSSLQKELEDLQRQIAESEKTEPRHVAALHKREREISEEIARLSR